MAEPVVHHHYHYHYFYNAPPVAPAAPPEEDRPADFVPPEENQPPEALEEDTDSSVGSSLSGFAPSPPYIRQGIEILDKDKGILSSYGYYNVRDQTQKHRRLVLTEATQYIAKEYIQERLYYIASVQPEDTWNPFEEDLAWFERVFHLAPYRIDPDA